jgi:uncharacterized membrane protein
MALVAWWIGQMVCGLCVLAGLLVLVQTDLGRAGQICAAALLLVGLLALIAGRVVMFVAARRPRRRLNVY